MASYYNAKSEQQPPHLPATWLIKTHYLQVHAHQTATQAVCNGRKKTWVE